jgi:alpha-glucosidase
MDGRLEGSRSPWIRYLGPRALRVTHATPGSTDPWRERPWLRDLFVHRSEVPAEECELRTRREAGRLGVLAPDGRLLIEEVQPVEWRKEGAFGMRLAWGPGDAWYGGGPRFDSFAFEKGELDLVARESPAILQRWRSYSAIPFFLSARGYAFFLVNSHRLRLAARPEQGFLQLDAEGPPADYIVIYGLDGKEILRTWTWLTGRPSLPPRWALGLWATGYPQDHQDRVLERIAAFRQRGIPLDALILDYHWERRFNDFQWRPSLFPEPRRFLLGARARGIRVGLIFAPFLNRKEVRLQKGLLNLAASVIPKGLEKDAEAVPEIHERARRAGHLLQPDVRWWFGVGGMLDFTHPDAVRAWSRHLHPLMDEGVTFFKNDDGEYVPEDCRCNLGIRGKELHNLYGLYYARAIWEGVSAWRPEQRLRPMIFSRSAWAGSQRYPGLFLGDQTPSFEHFRSTLRAGLNASLTGFAWWCADTFGLLGRTTPETHARSAALGLFCPIARLFWRPDDVDPTRMPWSHGEENERAFKDLVRLRYRLLPYLHCLAHEAAETGCPILRPLLLEWPGLERAARIEDQFMLGDALLFAPVLSPGATSRRVWLPPGGWFEWHTGRHHQGEIEVPVEAPRGHLPIFVRAGSIVPLGPTLESIPDDHRFDAISLHFWPPFEGVRVFPDEDGRTTGWREGALARTRIVCRSEGARVEISISATEGSFPGAPEARDYELVLHATPLARVLRWRGQDLPWTKESYRDPLRARVRLPLAESGTLEFEA